MTKPLELSGSATDARRYWRTNVVLVGALMTLGFAVSFVLPYFARSWVGTRWLGWTFSYYMAAQGAILLYVAIVAIYAVSMAALDRHYQARNGPAT